MLGIPCFSFEEKIDNVKYEKNVYEDPHLSAKDLKEVVTRFKGVYEKSGPSFLQDAYYQLLLAIGALFQG